MEKNQEINCTVESCKYNEVEKQKCSLQQIKVTSVKDSNTKNPDESMCSSYRYDGNK